MWRFFATRTILLGSIMGGVSALDLHMEFKNVGKKIENSVTVNAIYEESRHFPGLTYETYPGSHGTSGTSLPGETKKSHSGRVVFAADGRALSDLRNIPDALTSLAGYKLVRLEIEYADDNGKAEIRFMRASDKEKKGASENLTLTFFAASQHKTLFPGKLASEVSRIDLVIDAADIPIIELLPCSLDAWKAHGWKFEKIAAFDQYGCERDGTVLMHYHDRYYADIIAKQPMKNFSLYYQVLHRDLKAYDYLLLDLEDYEKHKLTPSLSIGSAVWNQLRQHDLLPRMGKVTDKVIARYEDKETKYGLKFHMHLRVDVQLAKPRKNLVLLMRPQLRQAGDTSFFTVFLK